MPIVDVLLPQMGEGLQEAFLTALLKMPGDRVEKDEPLFEMETDKAIVTVESAHAGRLQEWLVKEGDVVAIGTVVARIETESAVEKQIPSPVPERTDLSSAPANRPDFRKAGIRIPPRTRAYCHSLGIVEDEMISIPAPSGKLMPHDVDRYLAVKKGQPEAPYLEHHLSARQRALGYRLRRSAQLVIPASITCPLPWELLAQAESTLQRLLPGSALTRFEALAYSVAHAALQHPKFRSAFTGRDSVREYAHLNLGIAVHCPGDDLVTAVVHNADALSLPEFVGAVQHRVGLALKGEDQSDDSTQMILTYMADSGITQAIPVLVAPSIATLFVGRPVSEGQSGGRQTLNLTLTFDHRLINGIGAARFLNSAIEELKGLGAGNVAMEQSDTTLPAAKRDAPYRLLAGSGPEKDRRTQLESDLRSRVARLLGIPESNVSSKEPLRVLGLNSLMSVQLSQELARDLALPLPGSLVFDYPTLAEIAGFLAEQLHAISVDPARASAQGSDMDDAKMKSMLSQLSDEDAVELLEKKLDDINKRF